MWKKIANTEYYEVNDETGKVRSIDRIVKIHNQYGEYYKKFQKCELKEKSIRGYSNVSIVYNDGQRKTKQVHRLILETFNPVDGMDSLQVNHINGVKNDNRLCNLEWNTPLENTRHAYVNGLAKPKEQNGELNAMSKLKESDVLEILKLIKQGLKDSDIAKMFNVSRRNISMIRNNKTWKYISREV